MAIRLRAYQYIIVQWNRDIAILDITMSKTSIVYASKVPILQRNVYLPFIEPLYNYKLTKSSVTRILIGLCVGGNGKS